MSLRLRLALTMATIAAVPFIVLGTSLYVTTRVELRKEIDSFLQQRADSLADVGRRVLERPGRPVGLESRDRLGDLRLTEADSIIQVIGPDDRVIVAFEDADALPVDPEILDEVRASGEAVYDDVDLVSGSHRMITAPLRGDAVVQIARSLDETDEALAGTRNTALVLTAVAIAAAAVVGGREARRIARPI